MEVDYVIDVPLVTPLFKSYNSVVVVLFEIDNYFDGVFVLIPSLLFAVSQ